MALHVTDRTAPLLAVWCYSLYYVIAYAKAVLPARLVVRVSRLSIQRCQWVRSTRESGRSTRESGRVKIFGRAKSTSDLWPISHNTVIVE